MTRRRLLVYLAGIGIYATGFAAYYHEPLLGLVRGGPAKLRARYREFVELAPLAHALYSSGELSGDIEARLAARNQAVDALSFFDDERRREVVAGKIVYLSSWPFAEIEVAVLASMRQE